MLKMVRQAHHPTGKRTQKRYETTTNVDKVMTNEGYFKTRFARGAQSKTTGREITTQQENNQLITAHKPPSVNCLMI